METIKKTLDLLLRIVGIAFLVSLVCLSLALIKSLHKIDYAAEAIEATAKSLPNSLINVINVRSSEISDLLNRQLSTANSTLATTGQNVSLQSAKVAAEIDILAGNSSNLISNLNGKLIPHLDYLISNQDIPKLIKDTRMTMAFTGRTMSHVEATSDAIARDAPAITKSINGISADIHTLTSDVVKPQPMWKKILRIVGDAGAFARFF